MVRGHDGGKLLTSWWPGSRVRRKIEGGRQEGGGGEKGEEEEVGKEGGEEEEEKEEGEKEKEVWQNSPGGEEKGGALLGTEVPETHWLPCGSSPRPLRVHCG